MPAPAAPLPPPAAVQPGTVIVTEGPGGGFSQTVTAGLHHFVADEPKALGGADLGPNPYDLLLAALGTCTAMTVRLYARRKGWPLEGVEVTLRHGRVHEEDCENCENQPAHIDLITRDIALGGPLSEEQRARLMEIAERCPVHRTLTGTIRVASRLV